MALRRDAVSAVVAIPQQQAKFGQAFDDGVEFGGIQKGEVAVDLAPAPARRVSATADFAQYQEPYLDRSFAAVKQGAEGREQFSRGEQGKQRWQVFGDDLRREVGGEALAGVADACGVDVAHHKALGQC